MRTNVLFGYLGIGGLEFSFISGVILFSIVLALVPSVLSFIVLRRIPVEYRKQEPALAFLLIIPLFGVIWNFFVYPKISDSLRLYYESRADFTKGDCGGKLALWLCVMAACSFVPILARLLHEAFYSEGTRNETRIL